MVFRNENLKIGDDVWVVAGYENATFYKAKISEISDCGEGKPNKQEYAMYFEVIPSVRAAGGLGLDIDLFLNEKDAAEQASLRSDNYCRKNL